MNGVVIRGPKREKPYELFYSPYCDAGSLKVQMQIPFNANIPEVVDSITCTLSYDPRCGKITTQKVSRLPPKSLVPTVTTVVYEECTLNEDIPDERFKLPK